MNSIWSLALKDLKLMSRDKVGLFFIVGFPILMGLFFGLVMGGSGTTKSKMSIAIVDEDKSEMSKQFVETFRANESIEPIDKTREEAIESVRKGSIVGAVIIPKGFGETAGLMWQQGKPIGLGVDPARTAEKGMLQGFVMEASGKLMATRFQDPKGIKSMASQARKDVQANESMPAYMKLTLLGLMGSLDQFAESVEKAEEENADSENGMPGFELAQIEEIDVTREIVPGSTADISRKLKSPWDISFPSAMMWGVLACVAGFAISIVRERKQGTLLRLKVAPIPRASILAGKALACFMSVCAVVAFMVALGIILGMRPGNYSMLLLATVCVGFCFVGIMMAMSVIGKTEEAVSGAGWGVCVVMAMFGGGMIPLAFMPNFLRLLSNISPVKWGVLAIEGAIWRQFTLFEMMGPCSVLLAFGTAGLLVGVIVMRKSQEF